LHIDVNIAFLISERNVPFNLMSHAEVSNKWHETDHQDPISYFKEYGETVDDFRAAVQQKIKCNVINKSKNVINKSQIAIGSVKDVQSALNKLGYNCGEIDGIIGLKTAAAIKKFQGDNKLVVDGIAGPKTKEKLKEVLSR
jgi:peptidoglycan hydrolase-like protein with peptidoglycan-binding domain